MDQLKIYIDRLKNDEIFAVKEALPPEWMEIQEKELVFNKPLHVSGEAYIANDHLIIQLTLKTQASIPCSICNQFVDTPIEVKNLCLTEPLEELKSPIYDLSPEIRESILLNIPPFVECNQGKCPERNNLTEFLTRTPGSDVVHFPFADLDRQ